MTELKSIREGFGEALLKAGKKDSRIVALCADLTESTRLEGFAKELPSQFVQVGVAEQNMLGIAAGLALSGKIPFAASFAAFNPGRNWDQLRVSVAYSRTNVKVIGSHAGLLVGADGATHQALEDIAIVRALPNMVVMTPTDYLEVQKMVEAAAAYNGPVYIRFGREPLPITTRAQDDFTIGQAYVLRPGKDVTVLAAGETVWQALEAAEILHGKGIECEVISVPTIKPLDRHTILRSVRKTGRAVSTEDAQIAGGLGGAVSELLCQEHPAPLWRIGMYDRFGQSGSSKELAEVYGLDTRHIAARIHKMIRNASQFSQPPLN